MLGVPIKKLFKYLVCLIIAQISWHKFNLKTWSNINCIENSVLSIENSTFQGHVMVDVL